MLWCLNLDQPTISIIKNEAFGEGDNDQAFWVFTAGRVQIPRSAWTCTDWTQICINVWTDYVSRWEMTGCGGGLKW